MMTPGQRCVAVAEVPLGRSFAESLRLSSDLGAISKAGVK